MACLSRFHFIFFSFHSRIVIVVVICLTVTVAVTVCMCQSQFVVLFSFTSHLLFSRLPRQISWFVYVQTTKNGKMKNNSSENYTSTFALIHTRADDYYPFWNSAVECEPNVNVCFGNDVAASSINEQQKQQQVTLAELSKQIHIEIEFIAFVVWLWFGFGCALFFFSLTLFVNIFFYLVALWWCGPFNSHWRSLSSLMST